MSIAVECEGCSASYKVADQHAGKKFKCKECGELCLVPGGNASSKTRKPPPKKRVVEEDDYGEYDESESDDGDAYEAPRKRRSASTTLAKKPKKKKTTSGGGRSWDGTIPPFTSPVMCLGVPAVFAVLTAIVVLISPRIGLMFFLLTTVIGGLTSFVANIRSLIVAFREDAMCGLAYLFVPFYSLYHLITRWDEHKDPFMMAITGAFIILFPMGALALLN